MHQPTDRSPKPLFTALARPWPDRRALLALLAHPVWGLLILVGVLGSTLFVTYAAALPAANWLYHAVVRSPGMLAYDLLAGLPDWLRVIIVQGGIGGIGTVLSFIPILLVFFTVLGVLEESHYLAYASRITDRYLQWIGLPGMACIPLSMGFGCNTSAILGCRILQDRRSRLLAMILVPFVPCTSRLAVIALLTPAFFGKEALWVTWGLISLNLALLGGVGFVINRVRPAHSRPVRSMPLPALRAPQAHAVLRYVGRNIAEFLTKMRLIVFFSTLVWALSYFPGGEIEGSFLAQFGRAITPLGRLAGLEDWRFVVAMLASFASKENVVAVLGVLFPLFTGGSLAEQVTAALSPAARLSFLVMQMLFIPCASTIAAIRQETASWKLVLLQTVLMLGTTLLAGILVYQVVSGWR